MTRQVDCLAPGEELAEGPGGRSDHPGRRHRAGWALALLLSVATAGAAVAQPTVNGLFYGDGDDALYAPYATSANGSVLYTYYDAPTTTMYVALVVNHAVNDLVCSPQSNKAYTSSATPPWGPHRNCKRASDSEFATFTLECAPMSPNSWSWQQALGCAQTAGPPESNWVSNSLCGPSSPSADWPPGVEASSTTSWVANINTYQAAAPATRAWNLYTLGTGTSNWKSPFVASAPNDVTQVPGYPTYSSTDGMGRFYEWEWSMVYEWSVDLGPGGANCGDEVIVFLSGTSHHSPGKHGSEDDPFPPPPVPPNFSDWGDLPDGYFTTFAAGGARHFIKVSGPYLGPSVQAENDGVPGADATGDGSEEDGVTANVTGNWTAGSTQSFDVVVGNAPAGGAELAAWFDWNNDGDFDDPGEFFTWTGLTSGTHTLTVTVGADFTWSTDQLYARFRLASSAPGGDGWQQGESAGNADDGEVEDYRYAPGALPVTLNAFTSEGTAGGEVTVRWQTASETDNVGFELWGRVNGKWRVLSELIESREGSSALPQSYEVRLATPPGLTALQLVDYDTRGRPERFGSFRLDHSYGEFQPRRTLDWSGPRARREERLRRLGYTDTSRGGAPELGAGPARREAGEDAGTARWKKLRKGGSFAALAGGSGGSTLVRIETRATADGSRRTLEVASEALTHVAVTETGIQRVTYESLRDGGLDLTGVHSHDIAVTWRGEPVARWVDGPPHFGPGSAIEFLGRAPAGDDALYIDASLYQVSVDRSHARRVGAVGSGKAQRASAWYMREARVDRPVLYHAQSPTGDPWVERRVLARGGQPPVVVTLDLPVEGPVADALSQLVVGLGTITDLPDVRDASGQILPEHNVEVWLRRPDGSLFHAATASASGQRDWPIEATLPQGVLQPGLNQLELRFSTDYLVSLLVVDSFGVRYPTSYRGPSLDFAPDRRAGGYRIDGFGGPAVAAYAEAADGSLTRVEPRVTTAGGGYSAELRQLTAERYWVTGAPHRPAVFTTEAPPDLLSEPADLVVIAASSFVGTRALEDYVADRAALDPVVIAAEDIYNAVGYGMALPAAITDYLTARDLFHPFTHVQLVGADCYDRLNYISDCVSFLPLPTARVEFSFYSPSQNRLVDVDGDGVGDKAVAQFSVRDEAELATIVAKGQAWETSGLSAGGSALLIAEESDGVHDFAAQIGRLRQRIGWSDVEMLRMEEHPDVATAREVLRSSLDAGRSVTAFSGHSSPSVWAYRALLTSAGVADLTNGGRPTIMVPLACETTYDISPNADVLGHQLLFGGDQGALAISGAAALANLTHNELMANYVLDGLDAGLTLGEAVLAGRQALGSSFQELQDNWITQGDVALGLDP